MSEILQRWLSARLGVVLEMDPHHFGTRVSDGTLLARLLHIYDVINSNQMQSIVASNDPAARYRNLRHLSEWLKFIGVDCDESSMQEIADNKGSTAIRLFYQVFLSLENKDRLYFIHQQRKKENSLNVESRFLVEKIEESDEYNGEQVYYKKNLDTPLIGEENKIEWSRNKFEDIKKRCKAARERFEKLYPDDHYENNPQKLSEIKDLSKLETIKEKERQNVFNDIAYSEQRCNQFEDEDLTYKELMGAGAKIEEHNMLCHCVNYDEAKNYKRTLHQQFRQNAMAKSFKLNIQRNHTKELWSNLMEEQEREFDLLITRKLLKQSQYEKQITTKLFQTRNEKKAMAENRILVNKLFNTKRSEELNLALIRRHNEIEAQRTMNCYEADRNKELHRRLYAEKLRLKNEKHYEMCMDIMEAFVDLTVKSADYRSDNSGEIPRKIWNEWKEIFFKNQPIFDVISDTEKIVDDEFDEDIEEILLLEFGRQEVLNEHDMIDYLQLIGPWEVSEICPDISVIEDNQMVLGYVVHRLLHAKYPLPPPPTPAQLPPMTTKAIVMGVDDPLIIQVLQELLNKRSIQIIFMDDAINFGLLSFKDEMAVVKDIDLTLGRATQATIDELEQNKSANKKDRAKANKETKKVQKKLLEKKEKKTGSKKGQKKVPSTENEIHEVTEESHVHDKESQTPRMIPDDDPLLTYPAALGKQAFDILCLGEQIPDSLLVKMLVEYLKIHETSIQGWVIINYPPSYEQASLLEEVLTGLQLPHKDPIEPDLVEVIEETEARKLEEDNTNDLDVEQLRTSKLVPNPIDPPLSNEFRTYFTAYINAKKSLSPIAMPDEEEIIDENNISDLETIYTEQGINYTFYYRTFDFPTVKHLAKLIVGDMELPLKTSVELFGDDVEELKQLIESRNRPAGKKGNGPNDGGAQVKKQSKSKKADAAEIPLVAMEESIIEEPVAVEKGEDSKEKVAKKGKSKEKGVKKGKSKEKGVKKGKSQDKVNKDGKGKGKKKDVVKDQGDEGQEENTGGEHKAEKLPEEEKSPAVLDQDEGKKAPAQVPIIVVVPPPKPGEEGWEFINLPQPPVIQEGLATLWENLEIVYLEDFKEVFLLKRIFHSKTMPYMNFVTKGIQEYIARPDTKQDHVFMFQLDYNQIDEILRPDSEMKCELHYRVKEFQSLLWSICDVRKKEAEEKRRKMISDNWVAEHMLCIANVYCDAMQLEVDRCVDSVQLLNDYYIAMLNKPLSTTRLGKMEVKHLSFSRTPASSREADLPPETKESVRKAKESAMAPSPPNDVKNNAHFDQQTKAITGNIERLLTDVDSDREPQTPIHVFVADVAQSLTNDVEKIRVSQRAIINKESDMFSSKSVKKDDGDKTEKNGKREGSGKKDKTSKKKKGGKTTAKEIVEVLMPETPPAVDPIRAVGKRFLEEWESALSSEINRTQFRLNLLNARALADLTQVLGASQRTFYRLHSEITSRYEREVASVDVLCNILRNAIEEEVPIQHELLLDQDKFHVNEKIILFPSPPIPPPEPVEERKSDLEFRVNQLAHVTRILRRVATSSIMPERAFVYILDDVVVCATEVFDGKILPSRWYDMGTEDVPLLVQKIYGGAEYIDWKDFVVHALNVEYPDINEMLTLLNIFLEMDPESVGTVNYESYKNVQLWFEGQSPDDPQETLRMSLLKELLFTLFQVGDDECSYVALLRYFCKDDDPIIGFAKALGLSMGVRVVPTLEEYLVNQVNALARDAISSKAAVAAQEASEEIIEDVLEDVIKTVAGISIAEVATDNVSDVVNEMARSSHRESEEDLTPMCPRVSTTTLHEIGNPKCLLELVEELSITTVVEEEVPCTSYLSFGVVLNMLTMCYPWMDWAASLTADSDSMSGKLEAVFDQLAPRQQTVLAHQLLQHPFITSLVSKGNKFRRIRLGSIVHDVLAHRL